MWATPFLLNSYFSWVSLCVIFSVCHNCVNAKYHNSWYIYSIYNYSVAQISFPILKYISHCHM